jgi:hypothetical protein
MKNKRVKAAAGILMLSLLVSACQGADEGKVSKEESKVETTTEPEEAKATEAPTKEPEATAEAEKKDEKQDEKQSIQMTEETENTQSSATGKEQQSGTQSSSASGKKKIESVQATETESQEGTETQSQTEKSGNKAVVQVYAGEYWDSRVFLVDDEEESEDTEPYRGVQVSNVTDNSFDFSFYEVSYEQMPDAPEGNMKEVKTQIFKTHTATFLAGGTEAVYEGKDYTLHFTFPDGYDAYPVAIEMAVTGFGPLEGNTYVNNGIPGHEFS